MTLPECLRRAAENGRGNQEASAKSAPAIVQKMSELQGRLAAEPVLDERCADLLRLCALPAWAVSCQPVRMHLHALDFQLYL